MFAVASSIKTTLLRLRRALAIQINYFSPALKFSPPALIWVSNPLRLSNNYLRLHYTNVFIIWSSEYYCKGSMFSLMLPSNNYGSCRIIVIFYLSSSKLNFAILNPSIRIDPPANSSTRKIHKNIVDFPAPVLPTIPIFSKGLI